LRKKLIVAIDGPAGAGKSTISRIVARELGYLYIDTGAMYRAVTLKAMREGLNFRKPQLLADAAGRAEIRLKPDRKHGLRVYLDGEEVTGRIRAETVSRNTKVVAATQGVRRILRAAQKRMGKKGGVVMEGRDIGTAVFPDADVKFYLDATPMERAKRRFAELKSKGKRVSLKRIAHALAQRDYHDKNRGSSPLRQAKDAFVIDSTDLSLEKVAGRMLGIVRARLAQRNGRGV
jgi:cytidylate kinase